MVILFHLELYQHNSLLVIKFVFDFSVLGVICCSSIPLKQWTQDRSFSDKHSVYLIKYKLVKIT